MGRQSNIISDPSTKKQTDAIQKPVEIRSERKRMRLTAETSSDPIDDSEMD
jgi:hypothetical protein